VISLVTDDKNLTPKKMIEFYDDRWNIEVFFRDAKQLLGLGQYQNGTYRAAVTHLHLVCFAYALLTHIAIKGERAQGKTKQSKIASTADLQNELRRIVWKDFSKHVRKLPDGKKIFRELDRLFLAA
jgi:SRSO17 transposase